MRLMRVGAGWLPMLVAVAVAGCEVSSHGPRDREEVEGTEAMMPAGQADSIAQAVRTAVIAAFGQGAGAATAMPEQYTPDAVFSDESEQTYAGEEGVRRAFAQGVPAGGTLDINSSGAIGSGDLVVDMGTYVFTMPPQPGASPMRMNGRYLVALQRMDDGSWKIARQLTDAVGMGGAMPSGPPTSDTAGGMTPGGT